VTDTLTVDAVNLPALMGAKGVNIQRIQRDCNVSVDVPDRSSREAGQTEVEMTLSGLPEDVALAKAEFEALVPVSEEFPLEAKYHRHLIGQKGADIREFQDTYDVRLDIPKPGEEKDFVTIRGVADKIEAAKAALKEKMPQLEVSPSVSVLLPIVVSSHGF
jgi:predicted PilT family ATPase